MPVNTEPPNWGFTDSWQLVFEAWQREQATGVPVGPDEVGNISEQWRKQVRLMGQLVQFQRDGLKGLDLDDFFS